MAEHPLPRLAGPLLLTKVMESDSLGEILRARKIDSGGFQLVRRLVAPGIDAAKVIDALRVAEPIYRGLKGPGIPKNLSGFDFEKEPYLGCEYSPGHSLGRILEKTSSDQFPLAVDQALLIADKVVSALDAAHQFRVDEVRVQHRFVVPAFVWVTDEGEVRLSGFGIGAALLGAAASGPLAQSFARYVAPEARGGGKPGKSVDVYSAAAILFELLACEQVPLEVTPAVIEAASIAHDGTPIPDDISALLKRGLAIDPAARYESVGDLKKDLSKILFSGAYAPTTFNLAFFMNNLFRGEAEKEAKEKAQEETFKVEDYRPKPAPPPPPAASPAAAPSPRATVAAPAPSAPTFGGGDEAPPKSKAPIFIGVGVVAAIGIGAAVVFLRGDKTDGTKAGTAAPSPASTNLSVAATAMSPEAFEEEVRRRVAEEIKKLEEKVKAEGDEKQKKIQEDKLKALRAQEAEVIKKQEEAKKAADAASPGTVGASPDESGGRPATTPGAGPSAEEVAKKQKEAEDAAKKLEEALAPPEPPPAAPAGDVATVKEGDLIDQNDVDERPVISNRPKPTYPSVALRMRREGVVIMSILVNEKGTVSEVKLLRKASDDSLNEAAMTAARGYTYKPAVKQGKKVKTWVTETVPFKL